MFVYLVKMQQQEFYLMLCNICRWNVADNPGFYHSKIPFGICSHRRRSRATNCLAQQLHSQCT